MTRAALAVMAGLLCMLAGMRRASSLHTEERETRRWADLLAALSLILSEGTLPLPEAMAAAAEGSSEADRLLTCMAEHMKTHPLSTPAEAYETFVRPGMAHEALRRMFLRLGRGTLEHRRLAADQAAAEMALLAQQAAQRAQKDAKLYQTLGLTGGAALALLLL